MPGEEGLDVLLFFGTLSAGMALDSSHKKVRTSAAMVRCQNLCTPRWQHAEQDVGTMMSESKMSA